MFSVTKRKEENVNKCDHRVKIPDIYLKSTKNLLFPGLFMTKPANTTKLTGKTVQKHLNAFDPELFI